MKVSYIADVKSLGENLVELEASAYTTDDEGDYTDTVSATLDLGGNISFGDDGPSISGTQNAILDNQDMNSVTAALGIVYGADGPADTSIQISGPVEAITGYVLDNDGNYMTADDVKLVYLSDGNGGLLWDTRNSAGELVSSGIYVYYIISNGETKTGKLAIVR